MPWLRPSIKEIRARILADLNAELSGPDSFLRRASNQVLATAIAGAAHGLYGYIEFIARQINVITAEGKYLERHGRPYHIVRKPAAFSAGDLTISGVDDTVIPAGTVWAGPTGATYTTRADATVVAGSALVTLDAEVAGSSSNALAGVTLTLTTPLAGIESSALVATGGLAGGAETESDDSLRERILYRKRYPAMGGSQFDYVSWAREVPGVTRAWCFPRHDGANSVGVAFVLDGEAIITPNGAKIAEVAAYIESHLDPVTGRTIGRPIGAVVTVFALTAVALDPVMTILPDTAATRAEVTSALEAYYRAKAQAGGLLYLSQIRAAISAAPGIEDYDLTSPIADCIYAPTELPVLGEITWT